MRAITLLRRALFLVPRFVRRLVVVSVAEKLATLIVARRLPCKGSVVVAGLFRSVVGIGGGARLCLASLRDLHIHTSAIDITPLLHPHERLGTEFVRSSMDAGGGVLVVHINPPEFPITLLAIGRRALRHKRIVGYWHYELPDVPKSWRTSFLLVDEIWVPSHFVAEAVARHTTSPVYVVPHPVRRPIPSQLDREAFGIPSNSFVYLCAFDVRSGYVRKNPCGIIRAFKRIFETSQDATLVLKITEPERAPDAMAEIMIEVGQARNIYIIDAKLSSEDMAALINCCDVVISLHRSEGFGLVLAEAMLLGKPVVATRWSGNVDFMTDDNSALVDYRLVPVVDQQGIYTMKNQWWAEPDIAHAAEWLRRLKGDERLRRQIGAAAATDANKFFSVERYHEAISATNLFDWLSPGELSGCNRDISEGLSRTPWLGLSSCSNRSGRKKGRQ